MYTHFVVTVLVVQNKTFFSAIQLDLALKLSLVSTVKIYLMHFQNFPPVSGILN
jgi:hypothetical protein